MGFSQREFCEGHRRLGPPVDLDRICRGQRNVEGAPALAGLFRPAPDAVAVAMLRAHADQIATALAGHHPEPYHPNQVRPRVRTDVLDNP
jgi:hypothetical protein